MVLVGRHEMRNRDILLDSMEFLHKEEEGVEEEVQPSKA